MHDPAVASGVVLIEVDIDLSGAVTIKVYRVLAPEVDSAGIEPTVTKHTDRAKWRHTT
jgi:hypothetical protein